MGEGKAMSAEDRARRIVSGIRALHEFKDCSGCVCLAAHEISIAISEARAAERERLEPYLEHAALECDIARITAGEPREDGYYHRVGPQWRKAPIACTCGLDDANAPTDENEVK
jgi:hypothetical protein